ncbi:YicC/YloC family endoribonuclease [Thiomicrorhabdus sp. Milos-T2]|uniref:YicC/YloC family endoribonuclease n=1 Tax=Thiomicrorhabdus sp. Milos-T2 TaxID=90814 RepID=UPI00056DF08F|nr:YicC/YloC family endoribonuclease [Thiomicrorhabdus sp. Milos-T2]
MQKKYNAKSMTAFARTQENTSLGRFSWEIRSVNQRYLEINPRLPDAFRHLEPDIRNLLKKQIARGKIDISLSFENSHNDNKMQVNQTVLQPLTQAINEVQQSIIEATQVNPLEILKWPGVLQTNTHDEDAQKLQKALDSELLNALQTATTLFNENRLREGQALAELINNRCQSISKQIQNLEPQLEEILQRHIDKLTQRIKTLTEQLDEGRFHQEIAILAQKMDIFEEIDRLKTHIIEVKHILSTQPDQNNKILPIGRRLDFLMQELNREANTLGSKSIDTQISQTSVELKVLIEQMREQVQNIE